MADLKSKEDTFKSILKQKSLALPTVFLLFGVVVIHAIVSTLYVYGLLVFLIFV
jgi:hypothetical protein